MTMQGSPWRLQCSPFRITWWGLNQISRVATFGYARYQVQTHQNLRKSNFFGFGGCGLSEKWWNCCFSACYSGSQSAKRVPVHRTKWNLYMFSVPGLCDSGFHAPWRTRRMRGRTNLCQTTIAIPEMGLFCTEMMTRTKKVSWPSLRNNSPSISRQLPYLTFL